MESNAFYRGILVRAVRARIVESFIPKSLPSGNSFRSARRQLAIAFCVFLLVSATALAAFRFHFNLSTTGSLELLLIVLIALTQGFRQASFASLLAVSYLDYFFTLPLFQFSVTSPEDWVALFTFESTALIVSRLSTRVRLHASQAELQRSRSTKLYELSRAILLIDRRTPTSEQLSALIREIVGVESVEVWSAHAEDTGANGQPTSLRGMAEETYRLRRDGDDPALRMSTRVLKLGTAPIGAMILQGWESDPMLADAVASLAALALERARALEKESRAEAGRNTEQLRTGVLDALAHGFKTPLTAIQSASSGLLAIGNLDSTQTELVSIINEEATMLDGLTNRLLQTATLEASDVRLRPSKFSISSLVDEVLQSHDGETRRRVTVTAAPEIMPTEGDVELIRLALDQLLDNAAKYSPVGSRIDISISQDTAETVVAVANLGSTILPEERERIFERFYRGAEAIRGPTGTGIGLSIVRKTAEAHHGRTWVECEDGRTRFFFTVRNVTGARNGWNERIGLTG